MGYFEQVSGAAQSWVDTGQAIVEGIATAAETVAEAAAPIVDAVCVGAAEAARQGAEIGSAVASEVADFAARKAGEASRVGQYVYSDVLIPKVVKLNNFAAVVAALSLDKAMNRSPQENLEEMSAYLGGNAGAAASDLNVIIDSYRELPNRLYTHSPVDNAEHIKSLIDGLNLTHRIKARAEDWK